MAERGDATSLTVLVDREVCMGSGMCIVYAPETFSHDDATKAVVHHPSADTEVAVRAAVDACPMGALTLVDPRTEMA